MYFVPLTQINLTVLVKSLPHLNRISKIQPQRLSLYPKLTYTFKDSALIDKNKPFSYNTKGLKLIRKVGYYNLTMFNFFLKISANATPSSFTPHHRTKHFGVINHRNQAYILNFQKYYSRWVYTYQFLLNLFFYKTDFMVFANRIFKKEVLSFNWTSLGSDYVFFRKVAPYFTNADTKYGLLSKNLFERMRIRSISSAFFLDPIQLTKTLFFLRRNGFFLIGIVAVNTDPWQLCFPIITFSNNLFFQWFFFKWFLSLKQEASYLRFKSQQRQRTLT